MKRFIKLLPLSAMLALALAATPADAKPGKMGPGFHSKKHAGVKVVKVVKMSPGKKIHGKRLLIDGHRRHFYSKAPPPRRHVRRHHARRAGFTWIPGTWRFSHRLGRFMWVDGYWVRTRPHRRWVQGYWGHTPHGWHFVAGHWHR